MNYWNWIFKMKKQMKQPQPISSSGHTDDPVLIYLNPENVFLNLPFILTEGKILKVGFPYLKSEERFGDSKIEAVRLLKVWDFNGMVYLEIQNLTTLRIDTLMWNLQCTSGFYLWGLASFEYLMKLSIKKGDT
jgi:hypothetical protein